LAALPIEVQGGRQYLEQVDRGAVGGDDRSLLSADQPGDFFTDALRQVHPVSGIPAANQLLAPFLADCLRHPLSDRLRQGAERIAVEIDHALGQFEPVAVRAQRIGQVSLCGIDLDSGTVHFFFLDKCM
jgi:hypothetical protein